MPSDILALDRRKSSSTSVASARRDPRLNVGDRVPTQRWVDPARLRPPGAATCVDYQVRHPPFGCRRILDSESLDRVVESCLGH